MNFNITDRLQRMDRTHAVVLVASGALITSTCLLRIGLSGDLSLWNLTISTGLMLLDIGIAMLVHSAAKRIREANEERRKYDVQRQEWEAAQRRCEKIKTAEDENAAQLAEAEAEEVLRLLLNFDRAEKRRWAATMVWGGYYSAINTNTSNTRFGRKSA